MISSVACLVLDSVQFLSHRMGGAETYILDGCNTKGDCNFLKPKLICFLPPGMLLLGNGPISVDGISKYHLPVTVLSFDVK